MDNNNSTLSSEPDSPNNCTLAAATQELDPPPNIEIIDVWSGNLCQEMNRLVQFLLQCSNQSKPIAISIDTEFPGVVHRANYHHRSPSQPGVQHDSPSEPHYQALKRNVHCLKMIQLGLCFTTCGTDHIDQVETPEITDDSTDRTICWQFNFQFDLARDLYADTSIQLLKTSGMDFERHRLEGIGHEIFSDMFCSLGLLFNSMVTWISFHGAYDFAYLLRIMYRGLRLPESEAEYLNLLRVFFPVLYDMKHMMREMGGVGGWKNGGLNQLAAEIGVKRSCGLTHQAGSDSVLTGHVFFRLQDMGFFHLDDPFSLAGYNGVLFGLGTGFEVYCPTNDHTFSQHSAWTPESPGASRYDKQPEPDSNPVVVASSETEVVEQEEKGCWWTLPDNFPSTNSNNNRSRNNKKKRQSKNNNSTRKAVIPHNEPSRILIK